ncbi:MAG: copper amine oxidase N-terminal domain-containing protein [Armatimonadetes bacterium]|nr:copper amine oxidase N-terminal domain-containing protein [Armatimonadota bacterium]
MKPLRTVLAGAALATMAVQAVAQPITVYVDDQPVWFADASPTKVNDRVMVPLRGVFEKLGADVRWNNDDLSVYASKGQKTVWLRIGDHQAKVDGATVMLDQPAMLRGGSTLVPIRFISEALGADVKWNDSLQAVYVTSAGGSGVGASDDGRWRNDNDRNRNNDDDRWRNNNDRDRDRDRNRGGQNPWRQVTFDANSVIPVTLDEPLNSRTARKGDTFMATVDTTGNADYNGLPRGTKVIGHVTQVRAMNDKKPGVLALEYDQIVAPNGDKFPIDGSLISLEDKNVEHKNGRIIAKDRAASNTQQSVIVGAGAGAVFALLTKGNLLTDTLIGGALGYVYDLIQKGDRRAADVDLKAGTQLGLKVDRDFVARIGT